jgi:hypothetical protein
MYKRTAFGGILQDLDELTSIVLRPGPLDVVIERRCKLAWEDAPCPECGETGIQSGNGSLWLGCINRRYGIYYTRNTLFNGRTPTPGEIAIAFVLYADALLSVYQIRRLLIAVYDTVHATIREVNAALESGFYPV